MEDIKTKDDIKTKWLIEATQPSNTCPFAYIERITAYCGKSAKALECTKDNCKIKVGK